MKSSDRGIARKNTTRHVDTKQRSSVRQKRKQHVRTENKTKENHEEEMEMEHEQ